MSDDHCAKLPSSGEKISGVLTAARAYALAGLSVVPILRRWQQTAGRALDAIPDGVSPPGRVG